MVVMTIWDWFSEKGPFHAKHQGWYHPITVCLLHYAVVFTVTFWTHDLFVRNLTTTTTTSSIHLHTSTHRELGADGTSRRRYPEADEQEQDLHDDDDSSSSLSKEVILICLALVLYSAWLLIWRLYHHQPRHFGNCVWYEYCWLCNVTLNLSAAGLYLQRPVIAGACCVVVGIDQLLWYVDLAVYFSTGIFPVGVSKYIFWEGTNWKTRITCTHHIWTIPVLLYTSRGLHWVSFPLGIVVMITNVLLSRWMTPLYVVLQVDEDVDDEDKDFNKKKKKRSQSPPVSASTLDDKKYLNVNLSHELWKDIRIRQLQIHLDNPPVHVYLWRLLWRWTVFNALVFGALYLVCHGIVGEAPISIR
jgi:hypothetical protein